VWPQCPRSSDPHWGHVSMRPRLSRSIVVFIQRASAVRAGLSRASLCRRMPAMKLARTNP
jgi:hypothetical protein